MSVDLKEEYKWIKGYENMYMISSYGRVISFVLREPSIVYPSVKKSGYCYVSLKGNGESKDYRVHRLVAQTFIDNPNNYEEVNHIDGNKCNNFAENLEWCNRVQNLQHAREHGLIKHFSMPVYQIDANTDEIIREFHSVSDAGGIFSNCKSARTNITKCCKGQLNTCCGFKWRYVRTREENRKNAI